MPGDAIDYTPTEPLLVVEVDADVCFEHERIRSSSSADKDQQRSGRPRLALGLAGGEVLPSQDLAPLLP